MAGVFSYCRHRTHNITSACLTLPWFYDFRIDIRPLKNVSASEHAKEVVKFVLFAGQIRIHIRHPRQTVDVWALVDLGGARKRSIHIFISIIVVAPIFYFWDVGWASLNSINSSEALRC